MKKLCFFVEILCLAACVTGCNLLPNIVSDYHQDGSNADATKLLVGSWQVVEDHLFGHDCTGYVDITRDVTSQHQVWHFSVDKAYWVSDNNSWGDSLQYMLEKQASSGLWQLTIPERYDTEPSDTAFVSGFSPITIDEISDQAMTWEYISYGGDGGPLTHKQKLVRR